ncbi:MAG: HRDC domain-containing protein [Bacteroidales bacterium]
MDHRQNEQLLLATEFVQYTNKNIFLTGKAGTGKTTFLHNLKKITPKRMVVVAPTGVAAINAGGVTIHSFFQLSFSPALPDRDQSRGHDPKAEGFQRKFSREKIRLLKCIDLLVIDEVSMVRADILDAIDEVLRKYRNRYKPFGGVQLLMIGDLHQLSPVVKEAEWNILRNYYPSAYFFDSHALKKTNPVTIELKEIFRQSDETFIRLLNKVRENRMDQETVAQLNSRYNPGFSPEHTPGKPETDGYITLTTHNASAMEMNQSKLNQLNGKTFSFSAEIDGNFPPHDFPTEEVLNLKMDAQVMFIKNDPSQEKQFYNGKIGKITRITDDTIFVKCPDERDEIEVTPLKWENIKYSLEETTKEIREEIAGSFTQIPLKLAWAITIHKSQGLTFDRVIIDAGAAFAFGQVYVALSRCRTFEGIVLSTPISVSGIKTDSLVMNFSSDSQRNEPGPEKLFDSKYLFQKDLLFELFDFNAIKYRLESLGKLCQEQSNILDSASVAETELKRSQCEVSLFRVAEKFKTQLSGFMASGVLPEENPELQTRVKQAVLYFSRNITSLFSGFPEKLNLDTDNKIIGKLLSESAEKLQHEVFIRQRCLENSKDGFKTISYLKTRSNADLDFVQSISKKSRPAQQSAAGMTHPELYSTLRQWRKNLADEQNIPVYMVLPQKSMMELMEKLPATLCGLKQIKGIGPAKIRQFGEAILSIIKNYCIEYDITQDHTQTVSPAKKVKSNSGALSLEMYRAGKTIDEIATMRSFSKATIEGHLAHYVGTGELGVDKFVPADTLRRVMKHLEDHPKSSMGDLKRMMGNEVSYGELKFIMQHLGTRQD